MTPQHHPNAELLWDYASGGLGEPVAVVVATHMALCPACRTEVTQLESVAGSLFENLSPDAIDQDLLDRTLARLGQASEEEAAPLPAAPADSWIPQPLRGYLGSPIDEQPWIAPRFGRSTVRLLTHQSKYTTLLIQVAAGRAIPRHTHGDVEYTLVLQGGFSDDSGHYLRGDVQSADSTLTHTPVADLGEDCICLTVIHGRLKLTGPVARLLNPFIRY